MSNRYLKSDKNADMTKPTAPVPPIDPTPVLTSTDTWVRTIRLNRPDAFNAFNAELKAGLLAAIGQASADESVRVVIITGTGRAFCAGQDLKEHLSRITAGDRRVGATVSEFYNPLIRAITEMRKPVVAAVNGVAAGAGAALACACDMRIAAASASFSMAFAQVALSADSGASFTLPRLVGSGRALRMMLTGERIPADEALRIGLVDDVVADGEFADHVRKVAATVASGPAEALGWIKASVAFAATHTLTETLDFENRAQQACFASADHREALDAFVTKRPPRFHA